MKVYDIIPESYGRCSGRTFRAVLSVLHTASAGKAVAYVAIKQKEANRVFEMAAHICLSAGLQFERDGKRNVIEFPNGGYVLFVSRDKYYSIVRGNRYDLVFDY